MSAEQGETGESRGQVAGAQRCAVLAGGSGSRLGGSKAKVELAGRALIEYPLTAARRAGLEPFVVAKRDTELPPLRCTVAEESDALRHPLVGVVLGLQLYVEPIVVVACDTPLVPATLLSALAARPEPLVVVRSGDGLHPLLGRYSPALLPKLRELLGKELPMQRLVSELGAAHLDLADLAPELDPAEALINVNTPEDLARAEQLLLRDRR